MFAVIFEVKPRPGLRDEYLRNAGLLRPELVAVDGFMANERYASIGRPGWLVSMSIWRDEKAVIRWRTHALHHEIQGKGRDTVFADYHLRVGEIVTDTESDAALVQQHFDATEVGAAKAVSLTERPLGDHGTASPPAPGLVESDSFDSITRPGNGLYINSWRDVDVAEAGIASMPGRHRIVRVIRDYGMFARAEAPQYFPPANPSGQAASPDVAPNRAGSF